MVFVFNKTYSKPREKTQEEVQAEIDALTHSEFIRQLTYHLGGIGCHGCSSHYYGGTVTPNSMRARAFADRLARTTEDPVGVRATLRQDFINFDARQKAEAEAAKPWTPPVPNTYWVDHEAMKKATEELSTTQALLTTYPVAGCVPLRTLTPEELEALKTVEL